MQIYKYFLENVEYGWKVSLSEVMEPLFKIDLFWPAQGVIGLTDVLIEGHLVVVFDIVWGTVLVLVEELALTIRKDQLELYRRIYEVSFWRIYVFWKMIKLVF